MIHPGKVFVGYVFVHRSLREQRLRLSVEKSEVYETPFVPWSI